MFYVLLDFCLELYKSAITYIYIIQLFLEGEVNSGGYIPRCEASRYISTAFHLPSLRGHEGERNNCLVKSNWLVKKILRQNILKTLKFSCCLATLCFCVGMKIKFLSLSRIICKFSYYTQDSHMYILSLNPYRVKRFTKQACQENIVASFFPLKYLFCSASTY